MLGCVCVCVCRVSTQEFEFWEGGGGTPKFDVDVGGLGVYST